MPKMTKEQYTKCTAEESVPDMFATLAAAYISGKTIKATPRKTEPPEQDEPPAEEPAPKSEPEPEPAPDPIGYSGNGNDLLTDEDRAALLRGEAAATKPDKCGWCYTLFSVPYRDGVKLVYSQFGHGRGITPRDKANYFGFTVGENIYHNVTPMKIKYKADVNRRLMELVPTEQDAEEAVDLAGIDEYERKQIDTEKKYNYAGDACRLLYDGKKPTLFLYHEEAKYISDNALINYLLDPCGEVERAAVEYRGSHKISIYRDYIQYNRISAAYDAIVNDPTNDAHKLLKISKCITDQKTVRIELTNGHEVKVEAGAVKWITSNGKISAYNVSATDRQFCPLTKYSTPDDITLSDIVTIRHGGKILYKAEEVTK